MIWKLCIYKSWTISLQHCMNFVLGLASNFLYRFSCKLASTTAVLLIRRLQITRSHLTVRKRFSMAIESLSPLPQLQGQALDKQNKLLVFLLPLLLKLTNSFLRWIDWPTVWYACRSCLDFIGANESAARLWGNESILFSFVSAGVHNLLHT